MSVLRCCVGMLWGIVGGTLVAGDLTISEFMAQNHAGLRDEQGEVSDWVEIHNGTDAAVSLQGYHLTDSRENLTKWAFPGLQLGPNEFLVVFASGRETDVAAEDRLDARERYRRRLREVGLPERFLDSVPPDRLEQFLQQLERQRRRMVPQAAARFSLHANFKLSAEGEYLALVRPDGKTVVDEYAPAYPEQHADVSYGIRKGSSDRGALLEPTPGAPNSSGLVGIVQPVEFSRAAGLYEQPVRLELKTPTDGAEIRYTLNGAVPTRDSGEVYTEPLLIDQTSVLRVAAFRESHRATAVETRTFLFLDDVVNQSPDGAAPPGWPERWVNDQQMDYGMDPSLMESAVGRDNVRAALRDLPSLSLVAPLPSLFDRQRGIYVNARQRGRAWECAASLELLPSETESGFQIDGGLRIRGGFSRQGSNPKHAFRMIFRKEYGDSKLRYPLFGDEGVESFDKIDLRSSMNYSWAMGGGRANTLLRDVFSRDTQRDMGQPYTRSRFYHLYLNGHYWGIYMTQERAEAAFGASYLGGEKEDYDTVKTFGEVTDGTGEARRRLYEAAQRGFASDELYFRVQGRGPDGERDPALERLLDVDNVIDYMLITFYTGDKDGPGGVYAIGNNYYSLFNRKDPDGFKFFEHDSEHSLGLGVDDMTGSLVDDDRRVRPGQLGEREFNVHWLHTRLVANARYRERFTERIEEHFFNGGALTEEACLARLEARESVIENAILAHAVRWGDAQREPARTPEDWRAGVQEIKDFIEGRNEVVLRQLHRRGWYEGVPTPVFTRTEGSFLNAGDPLHVLEASGEVFVTLDDSDPKGDDGEPTAKAIRMEVPRVESVALLGSPAPVQVWVPRDDSLGLEWTRPDFADGHWLNGQTGVGYENKSGYEPLLSTDLGGVMLGNTTSAYLRLPFTVNAEVRDFDELRLKMRFDDGFVAYLNGRRLLAVNAPETLTWRSEATKDHADEQAVAFVAFPLGAPEKWLRDGGNLLAVHGLDGPASSDFLITPELEVVRYGGAKPLRWKAPGEVRLTVRARHEGRWSPRSRLRVVVR